MGPHLAARSRITFRILILFAACLPRSAAGQALEVRFLDVGQGDAILLRSGTCAALIDAGGNGKAAEALERLGVHQLDLLIASHNHRDHVGGIDEVARVARVSLYIDNGERIRTDAQVDALRALANQRTLYSTAEFDTLYLGDARLIVAASPLRGSTSDQNDLSVIVRLEYGAFSALFTGDSGIEELNAVLTAGLLSQPVALLKAAHHGARDGVSPLWLTRLKPTIIVVSAGLDNPYGHPEPLALRFYMAGGRTVYRTDLHGEIVLRPRSNGEVSVDTGRTSRLRRSETGAARTQPCLRLVQDSR